MELTDEKHEAELELFRAQAHVQRHMFSYINTLSLNCVVELGIPDTIHNHGGPMTLSQLVAALPIQPSKGEAVYRLMRLMIHSGFFSLRKLSENDEEEGYVLTRASELLVGGHPSSMVPCFRTTQDQVVMKSFNKLGSWFKNEDATPFETANGRTLWDYFAEEPERVVTFHEALVIEGRRVMGALIDAGRKSGMFDGLRSIVDVGGGTGNAARAVAEAFPQLESCTVFDLPHVVAGQREVGSLKFVGGDMFQSVPPADALLLKCVLHDWNHEDCVKILKRCKEAIKGREGGKVIIIEIVLGDDRDDATAHTQLTNDMLMMMVTTGKERTEKEWSKIFKDASFSDYKITSSLDSRSIIELFP